MKKNYISSVCIALLLWCTPAYAETPATYQDAYALTEYLYPGMLTKQFQDKLNAQTEQTATEITEQGDPLNHQHPCFEGTRKLIFTGLRKFYTVPHMRETIAHAWANHYTASELAAQLAFYQDPAIQRMNDFQFDRSKVHSTDDMNKAMLASGKFTEVDVKHIEQITTRNVYEFRKASSTSLNEARAKVDEEREAYFAEKSKVLAQMKNKQPAQSGCIAEQAAYIPTSILGISFHSRSITS